MARAPKFDESEILDRAMVAFWRHGWSRTSIRDLEVALDMKAPSIYRRFGSKDALGEAVLDHYVERVVRRRVDKHLSGTGEPVANVVRFLELSVTESGESDGLWGCLLTTTSVDAGAPDALRGDALARGLDVIESGLRREALRAAEQGLLADGIDAESATNLLMLTTQGLMALARSGAPAARLRARARTAVAAITVDTAVPIPSTTEPRP